MGYIYNFYNRINGKRYIGLTTRNLMDRYREHTCRLGCNYDTQKNSLFHRALLKYGIDNFDFSILEECDNSKIKDREIYWISYYNSYENGYNMTPGGDLKPYTCNYDQIKKLWDAGKNYKQISHELSCSKNNIIRALDNFGVSQRERDHRNNLYKAKSVEQYTLNGVYIQTFDSVATAARILNLDTSNICGACNKKLSSCAGYIFKYSEDKTPISIFIKEAEKKMHHGKRKVNQYDLDGNFIRSFDTIKEAQIFIGAKSQSTITNVCKGRTKTGYGYIWKYSDNYELKEKENNEILFYCNKENL